MNKFKIIKQVHTYQHSKTYFVVYKKNLIGWMPAKLYYTNFKHDYNSFFEAEMSIFDHFKSKQGGIISIDVNIYTYSPFSLS
jgi:hypothetical protein